MSVSNQPYSSINGMTSNSIKSLFVTEGESLVSLIYLTYIAWQCQILRRPLGGDAKSGLQKGGRLERGEHSDNI